MYLIGYWLNGNEEDRIFSFNFFPKYPKANESLQIVSADFSHNILWDR